MAEKRTKQESDYWMPGDMTFVHYGKGYRLSPGLVTFCIGEVATYETRRNAADNNLTPQDGVAKINQDTLPIAEINPPIMLQQKGRGRPVKTGKVSRMTRWRRKKAAEQGKLL